VRQHREREQEDLQIEQPVLPISETAHCLRIGEFLPE
jgi:hypothetical protein